MTERCAIARATHREALASFESALAVSGTPPAASEPVEQIIDVRFELRQAAAPLLGRAFAPGTLASDLAVLLS